MLTLHEENGTRPCTLCGKWESVYALSSGIDAWGICQDCITIASGPGKYQRCNTEEDLAVALILNDLDADESMGHDSGFYMALFDNYILAEDQQGFVSVESFRDDHDARTQFDRYFADGLGATEYDIYVHYTRNTEIYDGDAGKNVPLWPDKKGEISENRIDAALNLYFKSTGVFSTVWDVGERGDCRLRHVRMVLDVT